MKILHTADWHIGNFPGPEKDGRNLRADDTGMCIQHLYDMALLEKPQMILVSGDLFHQARVWADRGLREVEVAIRALTAMSDVCPVVVLRGTPNHDGDEQFSMLKAHFYGDDKVHIITEPTVFQVKGYRMDDPWINIACLPGFDRGTFRAKFPGLSKEEENMVFSEELGKIVLTLRAECDPRYQSVLMAHYTVPGCNTESGQTQFLAQYEPVLMPDILDAAGFDLVALGHIHRPQELDACKNTYYSGAINAMNFNDEGQGRGFWIHELPEDKHTFYKTPAREFLTMHFTQTDVEGINAGALDDVADNWWRWNNGVEGKIVRVLYSCTEDAHKAFNRSILERQLYADGAFWVSEISPEQVTIGTNKDELSEKTDPEKNLRLYLDEKGIPDEDVGEIIEVARPIISAATASSLSAQYSGAFVPISIEVKNYRNYAEAAFDFTDISFCTINGVNGAGKSSLFMDAILDCLFEEPREGDLTGWIRADEKARSGSICFTFAIGEHTFRVTRTRAKSGKATLNIAERVNGEWRSRSAEKLKDTQAIIENILGMDSLTFRSCALIMQDQYGLFLQASKEERMSILGNILGLGIYGQMESITRNCLSDINRSIAQVKTTISALSQGLEEAGKLEGEYAELQALRDDVQDSIAGLTVRRDILAAKSSVLEQARNRTEKVEADIQALDEKKIALRRDMEAYGDIIREADNALEREDHIRNQAAAHTASLEEEKQLLAEKAALEVKVDNLGAIEAEYAEIQAEDVKLENRLVELSVAMAAAAKQHDHAMGCASAAQNLDAGLQRIAEAEALETQYKDDSEKLRTVEAEFDKAGMAYEMELDARTKKLSTLESKAQMLEDSNCIDPENATCKFLADARKAKAELEIYRIELEDWKESQLRALKVLQNLLCTAQAVVDGLGYDPATVQKLRSEVESYRADAEEYGRRELYADKVKSCRAQMEQTADERIKKQLRAVELRDAIGQQTGLHFQMERLVTAIKDIQARINVSAYWVEQLSQLPVAKERRESATRRVSELNAECSNVDKQMDELLAERTLLSEQLDGYKELQSELVSVDVLLNGKRQQLSQVQSDIGALQERLSYAEKRRAEIADKQGEVVSLAKKATVYDTLKAAFSQDGIPHNIIRSMLPLLTSTANTILGQMTGGKMGMEFVTDKVLKSNSKKEVPTLDIIINEYGKDSLPYLSKSGGEKVKASLSAILALAETKSSQAGIQLGMLFIDEPPFLDADGIQAYCDALETIQARYANLKVMAITHDPTMKARFPQSIDIVKTSEGSRVELG